MNTISILNSVTINIPGYIYTFSILYSLFSILYSLFSILYYPSHIIEKRVVPLEKFRLSISNKYS